MRGQTNSEHSNTKGQNARMKEIFSTPGEDAEDCGPLMRGLACLPVFFSLAGKRVVIAGGSYAVLWKAELCQAAGAKLDVFSPDPCSGLVALARRCPAVAVVSRRIEPEDFRRRRARHRRRCERGRGGGVSGCRARRGCCAQRHRQARIFRFSVWCDRRSLAPRHRHIDRWRRARSSSGDSRQA